MHETNALSALSRFHGSGEHGAMQALRVTLEPAFRRGREPDPAASACEGQERVAGRSVFIAYRKLPRRLSSGESSTCGSLGSSPWRGQREGTRSCECLAEDLRRPMDGAGLGLIERDLEGPLDAVHSDDARKTQVHVAETVLLASAEAPRSLPIEPCRM